MEHICAHIWATREQQWGMHARIHSHIWGQQWGMHARIYGPHGSSNGACMRAYIPIYGGSNGAWGMHARIYSHIWGQQWGMHARIHGPYMGAAMGHAYAHTWPYMGAAMGHACAHTWPAL
jgi:hypothetical protein